MNIAVLVSGNGSNLQAIINAVKKGYIKAKIALVVSDNPGAFALARAKAAKIPTLVLLAKDFKSREDFDTEIVKSLRAENIKLVVLAGFMRLLSNYFIRQYKNKILNIHPSLLPSFKGTDGVGNAVDYGVKASGATVHFVDECLDHGPIILQACVEVKDADTRATLAQRIHKKEHLIYPKAIKLFVEGRLGIRGRKVVRK